jgi:acyl dehydratase
VVSFEELKVGNKIHPFSIKIDEAMYHRYNRLVHEVNPLHFNEKYAKGLGYRTIVVAGVFTVSFFLRAILDWIQNPSAIVGYKIRFENPVYLEDTITHEVAIKRKYKSATDNFVDCEVSVENQEKERVSSGVVTVKIRS